MNRDSLLPFKVGEEAKLVDLKKAAHLNGKLVRVLYFDMIAERFAVDVIETGKQIKVKVANLKASMRIPMDHSEYVRLSNIMKKNDLDIDSLREVRESLLTISGITDVQKVCLLDRWFKSMFKFRSNVTRKEIVSTMEIVIDGLDGQREILTATKALAMVEIELQNYDRAIELLEPWIEHHYGLLPTIAECLFGCYQRKSQRMKAFQLYNKADKLIVRKLYSWSCNIGAFYRSFVNLMQPGFNSDFVPIKPKHEVMALIESAISKAEQAYQADVEDEAFYIYWDKALLAYHCGSYDASIGILEEYNEGIQRTYGSEHFGVYYALLLMFHCYKEKNDFKNAKYCLKKFKKYAKPAVEVVRALEFQLQSVKGSAKNNTKEKKIRTKGRCGNPFCLNVEKRQGQFEFCSACRICKYCSRKCQRIHWKNGHKESCKK